MIPRPCQSPTPASRGHLLRERVRGGPGAAALIVATEWNEFKQINLQHIRDLLQQPVIFDARGLYSPAQMAALGFRYIAVGRAET